MKHSDAAEVAPVAAVLRWTAAGALVLGLHLAAGAVLADRPMSHPPDAAVQGMVIELEPVSVPQEAAPAVEAPPPASEAAAPSSEAAAPPTPASSPPEPAPSPDATLPEPPPPDVAEVPAPATPADTPPPPLPPKTRDEDAPVLAHALPPPRPVPRPRPRAKPKPRPVAVEPSPRPTDPRAAERARRSAARERQARRAERAERAAAAGAAPAPRGAEPQRPAAASAGEVASWRGAVVAHLGRFKASPPGGGSGTVRVSFSVDRGGGVSGVRLSASSGDAALDGAALSMVSRASPVPPPPPGLGGRVSLSVPVHFSEQ